MNAHDPDMAENASIASLRSFVERLVRLEESKKEIAADIKDVKAEAKSCGFDTKVVQQMVRETMMDNEQRAAQREFEEICEVYRAQLGMLHGTPLGDAARKRAAAKPPKDEEHEDDEPDDGVPGEDGAGLDPPMPPEDLATARERGRLAGQAGEKIFGNPYLSGDPRRAAWDEGFCEGIGSDGMEIPEAWRRKRKAKPADDGGSK